MSAVQYTRNFSIGTSTHLIKVWADYTNERGLSVLLETRESTRMADCLKGLTLTPIQLAVVKQLMREKNDGIVLEDGTYKNW